MKIGETIRTIRLQKGLTQGDIERRSGLAPQWVSRIEGGFHEAGLTNLVKLADAIGVSVGEFFGGPAEPRSIPQFELDFLREMRALNLSEADRAVVISMLKRHSLRRGKGAAA